MDCWPEQKGIFTLEYRRKQEAEKSLHGTGKQHIQAKRFACLLLLVTSKQLQCLACDQFSLCYLPMTALGGEPQVLLLSQVISAIAREDNMGSYMHKWSRPNRPPRNCYGVKIHVAKQTKDRQHQMPCFASSRRMSSRLKGPRGMGRCFHLSLQWQERLKFHLGICCGTVTSLLLLEQE